MKDTQAVIEAKIVESMGADASGYAFFHPADGNESRVFPALIDPCVPAERQAITTR